MKIQHLFNKYAKKKDIRYLIENSESESSLHTLPLIYLIFDIKVFTYIYDWAFLRQNLFKKSNRKGIKNHYGCINHPIFSNSYWVHPEMLKKLITNEMIKKYCVISSKKLDELSNNQFIPDYFLSRFQTPKPCIEKQILIFDDINYRPKNRDRSLREESFWNKKTNYSKIYSKFVKNFYKDYEYNLTLKDTTNIYLQFIALYLNRITNRTIETKTELFNLIFKYPFHPLWKVFSKYFRYMENLIYSIPSDEKITKKLIIILKSNFGLTYTFWRDFLEKLIDEVYLNSEDNLNINIYTKLIRDYRYDIILDNFLEKIDINRIKHYIREICLL